jgi:hypothetical protein
MKRYLIVMLLWCTSALGEAIRLLPGDCVTVAGRRICALDDRRPPTTSVETLTQRGNVFCVCEYGIREVARAGEPMKGYWLRQMQIGSDGVRSEVNLKNFGSDERACNVAVTQHPACNVGVSSYIRATGN